MNLPSLPLVECTASFSEVLIVEYVASLSVEVLATECTASFSVKILAVGCTASLPVEAPNKASQW